jgi:hypothetical protein
MRKLLALTLLLPLVLFSASTSLSASPATAISKLINRWFPKKILSNEFNRCLSNRSDYIIELDIQRGDIGDMNEEYFDYVFSRANKYCEAVIPEERRYKKTEE